jgi:hypothetical protein
LLVARSAVRTFVVAVELLFELVGSLTPDGVATDAVLEIVPVAVPPTVAVTAKVAVAPTFRLTADVLMLPEPDDGQAPVPVVIEHVQVIDPSEFGKVSVTVAPLTFEGPLLATAIV